MLALERIFQDDHDIIDHMFASDIEPHIRKFIEHFHPMCREIFKNALDRDVSVMPGKLDIYVAGFPCQPFARCGLRQGSLDHRGTVFSGVYQYIRDHLPASFLLENVSSLPIDFTEEFHVMTGLLNEITDHSGHTMYKVWWKILHTDEHGLPQHRDRVFIVGCAKTFDVDGIAVWPDPATTRRSLTDILDMPQRIEDETPCTLNKTGIKNMMEIMQRFERQERAQVLVTQEYIHDIGGAKPHSMLNCSPCLTKTRCGALGFYSSRRQRLLSISDFLRLQGVRPSRFDQWETIVSRNRMGAMCGNAIPQCLMLPLLVNILRIMGWPIEEINFDDVDLR